MRSGTLTFYVFRPPDCKAFTSKHLLFLTPLFFTCFGALICDLCTFLHDQNTKMHIHNAPLIHRQMWISKTWIALLYGLKIWFLQTLCLRRGIGMVGGATPGKRLLGLRVISCRDIQEVGHNRVLVAPASDIGWFRYRNTFIFVFALLGTWSFFSCRLCTFIGLNIKHTNIKLSSLDKIYSLGWLV